MAKTRKALSKPAQKLLERIHDINRYYPATYGAETGKYMQELLAAGFIKRMGRVVEAKTYFVPMKAKHKVFPLDTEVWPTQYVVSKLAPNKVVDTETYGAMDAVASVVAKKPVLFFGKRKP